MKMNMTFWVSSIPNHRMVSGMRAAMGMLRPSRARGAAEASIRRHEPARMPRGTPTRVARPKPMRTRRKVAAMLGEECPFPDETPDASQHFRRARQDDRRHDTRFGCVSARDEPPDENDQTDRGHPEQTANERRRRNPAEPAANRVSTSSSVARRLRRIDL